MIVRFVKAYIKEILLVLTPLVFSPLLFIVETEELEVETLNQLFKIDDELPDDTYRRLTTDPNADSPAMFKVISS